MSYFKLPLFFVGFLGLLLGVNSMENEELPNYLTNLLGIFKPIQNDTFPDGYPLPTENDFEEIKQALGYEIPKPLRQFYEVAGNLKLRRFRPAFPNGGCNSELYNLIRDCKEKMKIINKSEWLPFCAANGYAEFFCIHILTGEIRRYVSCSGFEKKELYPNFSDWATKSWLSKTRL